VVEALRVINTLPLNERSQAVALVAAFVAVAERASLPPERANQ
jgi:hypothetical protein